MIVAAALTQDETDHAMLMPMVEAVEQSMGAKPAATTADAGYWDTENVNSEALKGMLVLVNPDGGKKKDASDKATPRRSNPTMDRMRELLKTDEAKALYQQRKTTVEPVFGQIKQERGIREFRLRGLKKTKAEWLLICLTHNLLKLYRREWLPKRASERLESSGKVQNDKKSPLKSSCKAKGGVGSAPRAKRLKMADGTPPRGTPARAAEGLRGGSFRHARAQPRNSAPAATSLFAGTRSGSTRRCGPRFRGVRVRSSFASNSATKSRLPKGRPLRAACRRRSRSPECSNPSPRICRQMAAGRRLFGDIALDCTVFRISASVVPSVQTSICRLVFCVSFRLHFQLRISGMSSPCFAMYCLCSKIRSRTN